MNYNIIPSKGTKRIVKKAKKDVEFKTEILSADPDSDIFFSIFLANDTKLILASVYGGWVLAKKGSEAYKEL